MPSLTSQLYSLISIFTDTTKTQPAILHTVGSHSRSPSSHAPAPRGLSQLVLAFQPAPFLSFISQTLPVGSSKCPFHDKPELSPKPSAMLRTPVALCSLRMLLFPTSAFPSSVSVLDSTFPASTVLSSLSECASLITLHPEGRWPLSMPSLAAFQPPHYVNTKPI